MAEPEKTPENPPTDSPPTDGHADPTPDDGTPADIPVVSPTDPSAGPAKEPPKPPSPKPKPTAPPPKKPSAPPTNPKRPAKRSQKDLPNPTADYLAIGVGLLIGSALLAIFIRWWLETQRTQKRASLELQLLKYKPDLDDARSAVPLGDCIDASGIPKMKTVDGLTLLAYGYQLSNPEGEEFRLSTAPNTLLNFATELSERDDDDREWYRNVGMVVLLQKILIKQGHLYLGVIQELTRDIVGSTSIKDTIGDILMKDRLDEEVAPQAIAGILNETLRNGQGRSKYIVARALGLLFADPPKSHKEAAVIKEAQVLYAQLIDVQALLAAALVYPCIYDVYERLVKLQTPSGEKPPSTSEVVAHLMEIGFGQIYLTHLLHIKTLPHLRYIPKELVPRMVMLAKQSQLTAWIVDETFSTALRTWFRQAPKPENVPVVGLVMRLCQCLPEATGIFQDTTTLLTQSSEQVFRYERILEQDKQVANWVEEQEAQFRQDLALKKR